MIVCCTLNNYGQSPMRLYLGAGFNNPTTTTRNNALFSNSFGGNLNFSYNFQSRRKVSFGLNSGLSYFYGEQNQLLTMPERIRVLNEISNTISFNNSGQLNQNSIKADLGPQLNFQFGKICFSPIFTAGIIHTYRDEVKINQTIAVREYNNQDTFTLRDKTMYSATSITKTGLQLCPKMRIHYDLTDYIGIWAEGSYSMGPDQEITINKWVPFGTPRDGYYQYMGLIEEGKEVTETRSISTNSISVNGGIFIGIGKPKSPKSPVQPTVDNINQENLNSNRKCKEYSAPKIIVIESNSPNQGTYIKDNQLVIRYLPTNAIYAQYQVMVWKNGKKGRELIHNKLYSKNFDGVIKNLNVTQNTNESLFIQMIASPASPNSSNSIKGDRAAFQKAFCSNFENDGKSNLAELQANSSCAADYSFSIDSVKCIENKKVKVFASVKFKNINNFSTPNPTLNNVTFTDFSAGTAMTATNVTPTVSPLSLLPSDTKIPFSFELEGETCDKILRVNYDINWNCPPPSSNIQTLSCIDTFQLPCCYCNYCDKEENMKIENISQSDSVHQNNLLISQEMNITPKNIAEIKAEIVSINESEMNEACKSCRKNQDGDLIENEVYHFINSNTAIWNAGLSGIASAGNAANTLPTKILHWNSNAQGTVNFNLNIALPGTANLECCSRHGVICIRYTFTDIECKSCTMLVCYTY